MYLRRTARELLIRAEMESERRVILTIEYDSREERNAVNIDDRRLSGDEVIGLISLRSIGIQSSTSTSRSLDPAKELGAELFQQVFAGSARELYVQAMRASNAENASIAVRVEEEDNVPPAIPWELLYDPIRENFVGLSLRSPLIRAVPMGQKPPLTEPLQILVAAADVTGLVEPEGDFKVFRDLREQHPEDFGAIEILERTTLPALVRRLKEKQYHIVHFTGTGPRTPKQPMISVFTSETGMESQPVGADILLPMLQKQDNLRVLFLSADYSDQLARSLSRTIPVCVGLRELVSAQSAAIFARTLYESLIGSVSMGSALTLARQELDSRNPGVRDWCLFRAYGEDRPLLPAADARPSIPEVKMFVSHPAPSRQHLRVQREIALHRTNLDALESMRPSSIALDKAELDDQITSLRKTIAKLMESLPPDEQ